jgi:hypothetical protein
MLHKTAIAIPRTLLDAVDRAARERRESRNQFVTRVLLHAVRARRDAAITRRLNELFADPAVADQQRRDASDLEAVGTFWTDWSLDGRESSRMSRVFDRASRLPPGRRAGKASTAASETQPPQRKHARRSEAKPRETS